MLDNMPPPRLTVKAPRSPQSGVVYARAFDALHVATVPVPRSPNFTVGRDVSPAVLLLRTKFSRIMFVGRVSNGYCQVPFSSTSRIDFRGIHRYGRCLAFSSHIHWPSRNRLRESCHRQWSRERSRMVLLIRGGSNPWTV